MSEVNTPSVQEQEQAIVNNIEKLNTEFNASLDELAEAELSSQTAESAVFKIFVNGFKKNTMSVDAGSNSKDTSDYNQTFMEFVESKQEVLQKQTRSFRLLQKLRTTHNSYLVNVINALQGRIKDLTTEETTEEEQAPVSAKARGKLRAAV